MSRSLSAASSPAVFVADGPDRRFGASSPTSRRCLSQRLIVGRETANTRATSVRGMSASTASTTRHRKSSLYGFISIPLQLDQSF
jgi:hypothetical protein